MTTPIEQAEAAIREGQARAALAALTQAVKAEPGQARLRVFLAQLQCVLGDWTRAHQQLLVAADLDPAHIAMREMVGHALMCEKLRASVFAGERAPMVFGQPQPWLAQLIESLLTQARGDHALAARLSGEAFDAAPASPGTLDGVPFEWIADADSRLGPVLEAMVNGRYYWVPFAALKQVDFEAPEDLRDFVWLPAHLQFHNGGETVALVPTRYPGTESQSDEGLLLARRTEWRDLGEQRYAGLGQRLLTTDRGEHALLDVRRIAFEDADAGSGSGT